MKRQGGATSRPRRLKFPPPPHSPPVVSWSQAEAYSVYLGGLRGSWQANQVVALTPLPPKEKIHKLVCGATPLSLSLSLSLFICVCVCMCVCVCALFVCPDKLSGEGFKYV